MKNDDVKLKFNVKFRDAGKTSWVTFTDPEKAVDFLVTLRKRGKDASMTVGVEHVKKAPAVGGGGGRESN